MAWVAVLSLLALVAYGVRGQILRGEAAVAAQREFATLKPVVRVSGVEAVSGPRTLDLPGSSVAFDSATIYARATGFISKRLVDIGWRVKRGELLAFIDAPDLDQQLNQARAQVVQLEAAVEQARAQSELAIATNKRTTTLVQQGWQTKQQGDVDRLTSRAQAAAANVAEANLKAQKAVVSRLEELTGFKRVIAPFDGVITARNVDVGDLVTADISTGTALFSIDRTSVLRIRVYVPQDSVFALKDGFEADVTVPELPGRVFKGRIARNAGSLQPGTRTLLTEVDVDNPNGELRAGIYCRVHFKVPRKEPTIIIPSQALIFNANGLSAAVYENGTARLRSLELLRDNGAQVEVRRGLNPSDRIILNPPVNIRDGMQVEIAQEPATKTAMNDPEPPRGLVQRLWHSKRIENRRAGDRPNEQSRP